MRAWWLIGFVALAGCDNAAEKAAAGLLRDPSSAQFRNVTVHSNGVCGEINGKNAYGAYVGYRPFVYVSKTKTALIEEHDVNADYLQARMTICGD